MIGAWITLQVAVLGIVGASRLLVRFVPTEARPLQRALLLAVPLALAAGFMPGERPVSPSAQVWAPAAGEAAPRLSIGASPALPVPPAAEAPVALALMLAGTVPGLRALLGLRRQLSGAHRLRRVRGVEVWLGPSAPTPFAVWLGRPIVMLDPDTAFDPERSRLAILHELQHHRHHDALLAWGLVLLGVASPFAAWLRAPFSEAEELAVDRALVARGVPARPYAAALARIALRAAPAPSRLTAGLPAFLPRRLQMLLTPPAARRSVTLAARAAVALGLLGAAPLGWATDGLAQDHRVDPARFTTAAERLDSTGAFLGANHPAVAAALDQLVATPKGRAWAEKSLARAEAIRPTIEAALAEAGLPLELRAVPFVESGYRNRAESELPASVPVASRGAGYWMFIQPTARAYGLRVDAAVDERTDLGKETAAAVALLAADHDRYGDWALTLAAYNQGERAVDRAIEAGHSRDAFTLQEAGLLNDYVAQVYAAALVMADASLLR